MTKLEEARKQREEAKDFFWENEKLKEQILDVIIEVLNRRTKIGEFDPIRIVFHGRPSMKNEDILIGHCLIQYPNHIFGHDDNKVQLGETLPNLQWYARVIHAYLSDQKELEVTKLCKSEEDNSASFTVNFSIK